MAKIDLKKENKELYNPSTEEISLVNVPEMNFLMIDGQGRSQYIKRVSRLAKRDLFDPW